MQQKAAADGRGWHRQCALPMHSTGKHTPLAVGQLTIKRTHLAFAPVSGKAAAPVSAQACALVLTPGGPWLAV